MEFLMEMDEELDYNEGESPLSIKPNNSNPTMEHKIYQSHTQPNLSQFTSPREEGEEYSDDENNQIISNPIKTNRNYLDKEEGEASSEDDHRSERDLNKDINTNVKISNAANLLLDEYRYRNRLHEKHRKRERERERLQEQINRDTNRTEENQSYGQQINLSNNDNNNNNNSNKLSEFSEAISENESDTQKFNRKYLLSEPPESNKIKDYSTLVNVKDDPLLGNSPMDLRKYYKVHMKESESLLTTTSNTNTMTTTRFVENSINLSKYELMSRSYSTSALISNHFVDNSSLLISDSHSELDEIKRTKSKKSKREHKEKDLGSGDRELMKNRKKDMKQKHIQSATQIQYTEWEALQNISKSSRHSHFKQKKKSVQSRSASTNSTCSSSSTESKDSYRSGSKSHSSSSPHQKPISDVNLSKRSSQTIYDDYDTSYPRSKQRYRRETRETAPPPEIPRHQVEYANLIALKMKHKQKAEKRDVSDSSQDYRIPIKREKSSREIETQPQLPLNTKFVNTVATTNTITTTTTTTTHASKLSRSKSKDIETDFYKQTKYSKDEVKSQNINQQNSSLAHDSNKYLHHHHRRHHHRHHSRSSQAIDSESENSQDSLYEKVTDRLGSENSKIQQQEQQKPEDYEEEGEDVMNNLKKSNNLTLTHFPIHPSRYDSFSESESEDESDENKQLSDNNLNNNFRTEQFRTRNFDLNSDDKYDSNDLLLENKKPGKPFYYPSIQGCRSVEEFECLNRIEEGTYGVVYRARDKKINEIVALKRLKMEKEHDGFPITSLREINTLMKAQHENIVTIREVVVGSNMDKIYLVMDYVEHDLKSLMEIMNGPFSVGEVKCLLLQLLRAVSHLHDNWILHRDLKTSNLLLSHKGILKVGDFGLAREYGSPLKHYTEVVVTLWYRAPELLLGTKQYACPIDLWSVGCIFAEFLLQRPLFPGKSEIDELNIIFRDLGTPTERIWPGVSQLPGMKKCAFTDYPYNQLRRRFTEKQISDQGFDLLNSFLTYCPDKRITAEKALNHAYFSERPRAIDPSVFPSWPARSEGGVAVRKSSPRPPAGGGALAAAAAAAAAAATSGARANRTRYQPPAPPMGGQRFYSSMGESRPGTAKIATLGSGDAFSASVDKGFLLRF